MAHNKRDADRFLREVLVLEHSPLLELLAMVRSHDQERIVHQPETLQMGQEPREQVISVEHLSQVERSDPCYLARVLGVETPLGRSLEPSAIVRIVEMLRDLSIVVGSMRTQEVDPEEAGLERVAFLAGDTLTPAGDTGRGRLCRAIR